MTPTDEREPGRNPWLDIPVSDYEGHMNSPGVAQLPVLSRLLGEAVAKCRPRNLLLLGCASGNGLSQIDPEVTREVVAVDINPEYLEELRRQHPNPPFNLQAVRADVMSYAFESESFDMVHCALLLEYVDWPALIPALARAIRPGGVLSVVLQQPSDTQSAVTPTRFTSLARLETIFRFVDPVALVDCAGGCALPLLSRRTEPLASGKAFDILHFRRVGGEFPVKLRSESGRH